MSPRGRKALGWGAGAAAGVALAAGLYVRAAATPEPMQADELSRVVRRLASDGREGARMAAALRDERLTRNYGRAQHERIGEDVKDAREKLDAPGPGGDEALVERARTLADRLRADLEGATLRMSDAKTLDRLAADESAVAEELERMQAGR
jgi:hypothetical protein